MTTKICICILAGAAALLAAEKPAARVAAVPAKASGKAAPSAAGIPAGAVQADAQTWNYTAPDGSKWIYRKTPFGVMRSEDKPQSATWTDDYLKASEDGDAIRFERPTPFGVMKWTRNRSELNDTERQAWERARAGAAPAGDKQE